MLRILFQTNCTWSLYSWGLSIGSDAVFSMKCWATTPRAGLDFVFSLSFRMASKEETFFTNNYPIQRFSYSLSRHFCTSTSAVNSVELQYSNKATYR